MRACAHACVRARASVFVLCVRAYVGLRVRVRARACVCAQDHEGLLPLHLAASNGGPCAAGLVGRLISEFASGAQVVRDTIVSSGCPLRNMRMHWACRGDRHGWATGGLRVPITKHVGGVDPARHREPASAAPATTTAAATASLSLPPSRLTPSSHRVGLPVE